MGQGVHVVHGDVADPAFDLRDVTPGQARGVGQILKGLALPVALRTEIGGKARPRRAGFLGYWVFADTRHQPSLRVRLKRGHALYILFLYILFFDILPA